MSRRPRVKVLWYINPLVGALAWKREERNHFSYESLQQLGKTLDRTGFYGALSTPAGGHDAFLQVASLIPVTEKIRFLVPIYPGIIPPALLAEKAATFDAFSGGRLLFNQVNGQDFQLSRYGNIPAHDQRYEVSAEYWAQFKRIYSGERAAFNGKYFSHGEIADLSIFAPPGAGKQFPHTPVWGSGDSPAGRQHAGKVLDTYLIFLRHPDKMRQQISDAKASAAAHGRQLRIGVLGSVIVRKTEEEAWAHAESLLTRTGVPYFVQTINFWFRLFGRSGNLDSFKSENPQIQARVEALRAGKIPDREALEVYPNIWSGVTIWSPIDVFDTGHGSYLVGNPEQVADRIRELQDDLGIDTFILSGWPLIEEAETTAELLFPHLDLDHEESKVYAEPPKLAAAA